MELDEAFVVDADLAHVAPAFCLHPQPAHFSCVAHGWTMWSRLSNRICSGTRLANEANPRGRPIVSNLHVSSVASSKMPRDNFFISFSTRMARIVPVQAICFAVRQSTSFRDVTRLPNVKWNEFPTSSYSSEIRFMTTDPPMPSPSYCVCCPYTPVIQTTAHSQKRCKINYLLL